MRGPCGRGHEIAVGMRTAFNRNIGIRSARSRNFRRTRRITAARFAFQHTRSREDLRAVADGGDRLICLREMFHDRDDARIEPQVLRRAAAGQHERIVILLADFVERGVEREIVAGLLAVRLRAFEIVDRSVDAVAGALLRATAVRTVCPVINNAWNGTITS